MMAPFGCRYSENPQRCPIVANVQLFIGPVSTFHFTPLVEILDNGFCGCRNKHVTPSGL